MWKTATLAALATMALAVTPSHPAQAQPNNCAVPLQANNGANPGVPRNWFFNPITQQWRDPNSALGRREAEEYRVCQYRLQHPEQQRVQVRQNCTVPLQTNNGANPGVPRNWFFNPISQ